MSNHRISGFADPIDADDAVTRRYVASRFQALSDEVQGNKRKLDGLLNLFGVENNQVLIREYVITGTDFDFSSGYCLDQNGIITFYRKRPLKPNESGLVELEIFDMFTLKEHFIHLLEKPVDDVVWLRIKQPGTYTF